MSDDLRTRDQLLRVEEALRERIKELGCLYAISEIIEKTGDLDAVLQRIAEAMVPAWLFPESACARILWQDKEYRTNNFQPSQWVLSSNLMERGEPTGVVEIRYLEEKPGRDEGPFLQEERRLLDAVAERLQRFIERKQMEVEREHLIEELQQALKEIRKLSGLLPICMYCKKIRDDAGYWNQIESYLADHSEAMFSHGICPDCFQRLYPDNPAEKA